MGISAKWITPFVKQCFVVAGASLSMSQICFVMGLSAILLPQLRQSDSVIPIDDTSGSWVAALPGFALAIGNVIIPTIMAKLGRKKANIICLIIVITGWILVFTARNITWLLVARFLQGLSNGMSSCLCPVLIGEYSSPENRGAFCIAVSLAMVVANLAVHAIGSYVTWQNTAIVCTVIATIALLIVFYSPETPSWLADQGRYEDCRKVFQWLRGGDEEELEKMIEASKIFRESRVDANVSPSYASTIRSHLATVRRREFYRPLFVMFHIYIIGQWAGNNILGSFIVDIANNVVGKDVNITAVVISVDTLAIFGSILAMFITKKMKRRTMLFTGVGLTTAVLLVTAGYTYARSRNMLPFDHPYIGVALVHLHYLTVTIGSLPLPFTIAGEIFPIQFRSLLSGISSVFSAGNVFICVMSFPFLVKYVGIYGAYFLYAGILIYCLVIAWFFLPETKDRTLQDIEEELRGEPLSRDKWSITQPLADAAKTEQETDSLTKSV